MANKRMFSLNIIDTDFFLDMPVTSQALYFHLGMRADDDGFIDNPKKIIRMIGFNEGDMENLFDKGFVIPFDSGVCVIRHWRINNYLRSDRYHSSIYTEEKSQLKIEDNGVYTLGIPGGIPPVKNLATEYSIDKTSIDKSIVPYTDIISFLNKTCGTKYLSSTKKTKALILARMNEGFGLEDFKIVITKKYKTWNNTEWEKFLRPETLFGPKFEGYLNEKSKVYSSTAKTPNYAEGVIL